MSIKFTFLLRALDIKQKGKLKKKKKKKRGTRKLDQITIKYKL